MESNEILANENTDSTICLVDSSNVMDSNLESIHNNVDSVILDSNKISVSSEFKTKCEAMVLMSESFQMSNLDCSLITESIESKNESRKDELQLNDEAMRLGSSDLVMISIPVEIDIGPDSVNKGKDILVSSLGNKDNIRLGQGSCCQTESNKDYITDVTSYAQTVSFNSNSVDATIKVIPKSVDSKVGEVEMPYSNLMLGSAPYH
ncbi:hypothetical protein L2E82_10041 [Cichorium intybus]|uniref:Uncharacterized protein n=1 Tax=Cichorium intybus TaxID=13427 RepID=A0ACB9G9P4_CICIN|nr:hypothetical protein L2E82_10041 [Cichorium intybus]